jgi:hypothetical protein
MLCDDQFFHYYKDDSLEQGCMLIISLNPHIKIIQINQMDHTPMTRC